MTSRALLAGGCRSAALILAASLLSGCGANKPITLSDPPGSPANITGNWEFSANAGAKGTEAMAIYLTSDAGSVSGTAVLPPEPQYCVVNGFCGGPLTPMNPSLTGTVDEDGNLTLGSNVAGGDPVFAMAGTVNEAAMSNGTFTLTGTQGTISEGSVTGTKYPALDGTYSGTVTSQNTGQNFTVTMVLDQSSGPNSSGFLGLTGTLTVTGYSCVTSAAMPIDISFIGNTFGGSLNVAPNEALGYSGVLSPGGKTLAIGYGLTGASGSCNDDNGTGTLTLQ